MGDNPLYRTTPMEKLVSFGPDVMINLSASPYNYAQDVVRNSIVKAHTLKYRIPMLYCNTVGSQTEIVFDGGSLIYDMNGRKVSEMKYFQEDRQVFELEDLCRPDPKFTEKLIKENEPVFFLCPRCRRCCQYT